MKIHPNVISEREEFALIQIIQAELDAHGKKCHGSRNRLLRYGWDYLNPKEWLSNIPSWVPEFPELAGFTADNITINEYLQGDFIEPHTDLATFGDVVILSIGDWATMRFTRHGRVTQDFMLYPRSLAIMSGELRSDWKHETLPLLGEFRYSIVYRERKVL